MGGEEEEEERVLRQSLVNSANHNRRHNRWMDGWMHVPKGSSQPSGEVSRGYSRPLCRGVSFVLCCSPDTFALSPPPNLDRIPGPPANKTRKSRAESGKGGGGGTNRCEEGREEGGWWLVGSMEDREMECGGRGRGRTE